ncbi:MAG: sugar-binding domain-containing protein [Pseudomonadota bacterium]
MGVLHRGQKPGRSRRDAERVALHSAQLSSTGARRWLGARCSPLHAPAVCAKSETARVLRQEPVIASQLASLAMFNTVMVAVGETHRESHIRRSGYMTAEEDAFYEEKSPAAATAGRFISNQGVHNPGPIDERIIGISLTDLRAIRQRVVVCVGAEPKNGLRATLRGRFAAHVVTDVDCATQLVGLDP